jgi:hypothetical protein
MGAIYSSERLVGFHRATERYNPENIILSSHYGDYLETNTNVGRWFDAEKWLHVTKADIYNFMSVFCEIQC